MATVLVSRQAVDEDNQLNWELVEVDETDLTPIETPYVEATE